MTTKKLKKKITSALKDNNIAASAVSVAPQPEMHYVSILIKLYRRRMPAL